MFDLKAIDVCIEKAQAIGNKEVLTSLIKAKNAMILSNLITSSSANVKLGWRGKCEALNLADIKVEF